MKSSVKLGVIVVAIGLAIFGYTEVWGAEWKVLGSTDLYVFSYDAKNIVRPSKRIVRTQIKFVFTEKGGKDIAKEYGKQYENVDHGISSIEFNCVEKMKRYLSTRLYAKDGLISISDNPEALWESIRPETIEETVYEEVCK
jgi:hypothetical protein